MSSPIESFLGNLRYMKREEGNGKVVYAREFIAIRVNGGFIPLPVMYLIGILYDPQAEKPYQIGMKQGIETIEAGPFTEDEFVSKLTEFENRLSR